MMAKIKTNKEMSLAELIQHITENKISDEYFTNEYGGIVDVSATGKICVFDVMSDSVFEVGTEEEITEETKIPMLLEICDESDEGHLIVHTSKDASVADTYDSHSLAFHMINSDGTIIPLWTKEKGWLDDTEI